MPESETISRDAFARGMSIAAGRALEVKVDNDAGVDLGDSDGDGTLSGRPVVIDPVPCSDALPQRKIEPNRPGDFGLVPSSFGSDIYAPP